MKKLPDKEVEVDDENQPVVEVTSDAAAAENGTRSSIRELSVEIFSF